MERDWLARLWTEAWDEGLWHAAWSKAVEGLTATQAAWKPNPDRHSIWQILHHIIFWREYTLREIAGSKPDDAEIQRRNWEEPVEVTERAWEAEVRRFKESQEQILALIREGKELERLVYYIPHDSYHIGQIMYLRALQGFPPVD